MFSSEFRDVYNLIFTVVLVTLLVVAVRRRVPAVWTTYLAVGLIIASSANNIDSIGRYGIVLAPASVRGTG